MIEMNNIQFSPIVSSISTLVNFEIVTFAIDLRLCDFRPCDFATFDLRLCDFRPRDFATCDLEAIRAYCDFPRP